MKTFKLVQLFCFVLPFYAYSGVEIERTRVIYNEGMKQAVIAINNPDKKPFLAQSWIETKKRGKQNLFIIMPHLSKLEAKSKNNIKIINTKPPKLIDRESVFWLNIKVLPSSVVNSEDKKAANNLLTITITKRMKLFYRPKGLKGDPNQAYKKLQFNMNGKNLKLYNPTPYHVSFYNLSVNGKKVKNLNMINPYQKLFVIKLNTANATTTMPLKVIWQAINDYGSATEEQQVTLN